MTTVTVSSKGQITLPKRLRDELDIREGDRLEVVWSQDRIEIKTPPERPASKGWRAWRGSIAGTTALSDHLQEHSEEVAGDRLP